MGLLQGAKSLKKGSVILSDVEHNNQGREPTARAKAPKILELHKQP
jgi:hypothetical protein